MEGVPDWVDPVDSLEEQLARTGWRARGHEILELLGALVPGVAIAGLIALAGSRLAAFLGITLFGLEKSPVSPILVAIAIGLVVRNTIGVPSVFEAGLQLSLKRVLRFGVALLGVRLSLAAVGEIGFIALPIVVASITTALLVVGAITRAFSLPRRLGTLIAAGTAICGNTAIVALGPALGAKEDEVSYAVGTVTVFGLLALIAYPFLSFVLFGGDARLAGLFLGTAIHDTAQVVGAGLLYAQQYGTEVALDTATVTKLLRNVFMLLVIPLLTALETRRVEQAHAESGETGQPPLHSARSARPPFLQVVPLFVFGFLAMALLRTVGDLSPTPFGGLLTPATWQGLIAGCSQLSSTCLVVAMAAVGLGTNLRRLKQIGLGPLAVGLVAALTVGILSAGLIRWMA